MTPEIERSRETTVYRLVAMRAHAAPDALAIVAGDIKLTYRVLLERVERAAAGLAAAGLARGDRVALLSENRWEYTVVQLAAAKLGLIVACQNWRLSAVELQHCVGLVSPSLLVASERYRDLAESLLKGRVTSFDDVLAGHGETQSAAEPEDGLLIIYTSGTTGLPKAALISHRASVARMSALRLDLGISSRDAYVSWAPMFHIGGTEHLLSTLMSGGVGIVVDGFDVVSIAHALATYEIGWLLLVPSTLEPLLAHLAAHPIKVRGVKAVGCMPDLVPSAVIEGITRALNAPFLNTFGATETGMPPLSGDLIPIGTAPARYPKRLSVLTEIRLLGADGQEVAMGEVGEACVRGPTLFSGYWKADRANEEGFRGGWFHMGDLFRQTPEGYEFVGRSKYLIKSGGENIYPAEIERVLLADPRVIDAIVVRKPDARWGEVPAAVIARSDPSLDEPAVLELCRTSLAGYKRPRHVQFIEATAFPRSASGKIVREEVEAMLTP